MQFIPLFTRTAEEVLKTLLARVIFDKGVPSVFMSDEAPEFVGKLMKGLCSALGIKQMTTKAYNPRGNSICETVHKFLGSCLTSLPVDQRPAWPDRLQEFAFAHNTTEHDSIQYLVHAVRDHARHKGSDSHRRAGDKRRPSARH